MTKLIERLQILHESDIATGELIALGVEAVPALKAFLLSGRPSTVFQPRMNAVRALANIGLTHHSVSQEVKRILIVYLRSASASKLADAAVMLAEEAVRNTAAEELANWHDDSVASLIVDLLREHPLAGACRAAGRLRLSEAIPFLTASLSDDVVRPVAMESLEEMLREATPTLIHTVLRCCPPYSSEPEPAQQRRARAAAAILSEAVLTPEAAFAITPALDSEDPEVIVGIAAALLRNRGADPRHIAEQLLRHLPESPWFVREQARDLLETCGPEVADLLDDLIRTRSATDPLLPMLFNLKRHLEGNAH